MDSNTTDTTPNNTTITAEAISPPCRKIKWRKPRKPEDISIRYTPDATFVTAQDGTEIIFDPGDFETKVRPINGFLFCNRSGQGATHVRIGGSIEPGKPKNNLQVSRLVLGLKPDDPREVFFLNRNQRDMRWNNLDPRGSKPVEGDTDQAEGDV